MSRRGNAVLQAWELARLEERETTQVTALCGFCDWTQDGTVRDTRAAYLEHRTTEHPEVKPAPRARRRRLFGQINTGTDLTANIAAARAQGAAGWAGDE